MTNALYNLLSKLSLVLIALAATTTATYSVSPPSPPIGQNLAIPSVLERVAACESTGNPNGTPRQFNADGSILWGQEKSPTGTIIIVKRDVGEFQINTWAHASELEKLGLDVVNSQADNIKYAFILYNRNGLKDWSASESCWQPK